MRSGTGSGKYNAISTTHAFTLSSTVMLGTTAATETECRTARSKGARHIAISISSAAVLPPSYMPAPGAVWFDRLGPLASQPRP